MEGNDPLIRNTYLDVHSRYIQAGKPMESLFA